MKLQTRVRLGVVIVFAVLIVAIVGLTGREFMRGLGATEEFEAREEGDRTRRIVEAEIEAVRRTARDYAEWDDTVAYVRTPTATYEAANWAAGSFANIQVDGMLVYDGAGASVGGALLAPGGEVLTRPTAGQIAALADEVRRVVTRAGAVGRLSGLCRFDGAPAFFACQPVLPTGGEGAAQGALVVVRRIDGRLHERLEQILGMPTELTVLDPAPGGAATGEDLVVEYPSAAQMTSTVRLRDGAGVPLLAVRLELPRVAHQEGVQARWRMLWLLVGAAVVVAFVTNRLLRSLVIRRLEDLSAELVRLGAAPVGRARVRVVGGDEIAVVERRVNDMLDGLERADRERAQARKERELLQEQLLHAQKMEAVGEFAGGVAHDFNNCLTSIVCWLQLTKQELPAEHPTQENLDLALNSVTHATSVVRQLLTYSRHGAAPLARLRLGELLSESLLLLRSGLPRSIELRLHAAGCDDRVMADRTQLLQVLMNLLNNARDAMDGKGTLTISLDEVRLPSPEAAPAAHLPAGDYVRISVRDTGPGIPPEQLAQIFRPFFTTKPAGKGTGLGLAVVQSVVSRHSGTVWVESRPGEGAVFHVLIPRCAAEEAAVPPVGEVRGLRVLLVEDDPAVAQVLTTALERRDCVVTLAGDGAAAWERFAAAGESWQVVLTDLTMPRLNGLQLAERIAESERRVPVVLMTAYGAGLTPEQIRRAGLAAVLSKPLMYDDVVAALAKAVGAQPV